MFDRKNLRPKFNVTPGSRTGYGGATVMLTPAESGLADIEPRNSNFAKPTSGYVRREVSPYTEFGMERK